MKAQAFKKALASGPRYGLFCSIASYHTAEALAGSGFDFLIFDGEHSPIDIPLIHTQLMAISASKTVGIVRVPSNDIVAIKQCLDLGADGIMVPRIDTAEQARRAVSYARYPPGGVRGIAGLTRATQYTRDKTYAANANERFCLVLQIESPLAMKNLDEICAVEGVDALFFGPNDYAANSGHLGQPSHPEVQAAVEEGIRRVRRNGKVAGLLCSEADAPRFAVAGATLVTVGADLSILISGADGLAKRLKDN